MKYFVYLIITKRINKIISYVGYTNDLKKRLKLHNASKGAKFTKGNNWLLIYKKIYKSRKSAMTAEYLLKKNHKLRSEIKKRYLNK